MTVSVQYSEGVAGGSAEDLGLEHRSAQGGQRGVIAQAHRVIAGDLDPEALQAVAATAKRVAHALKDTLHPDGLMVFQLNGAAAGQTVFHYHMHLMPRAEGEPLALHTRVPGDPQRLATLAKALAEHVSR